MAEMDDYLQQEDTQHGRFLTFLLGNENFALEIRYVIEIIGMQTITPLPETPNFVKGIISLRSKIIPVIDMRLKLCKEPVEYNERTCIIVVEFLDVTFGLIVDRVLEVLNIDDESIEPPPKLKSTIEKHYLKGIGKMQNEVKLILDCEKLLTDDQIEQITDSAY